MWGSGMHFNDHANPPNGIAEVFWGEMAPCEHLVQIYQDDGVFLDSLEGFIWGGLMAGDGVVVIATSAHHSALQSRLVNRGFDIVAAKSTDQYVALDAEETLSKFIINGWPQGIVFGKLC